VKIIMTLDRRTYAGAPIDIVRKLRADAVHMKTRDTDAYMRAVVTRLRAEQQADIKLEGDSLEERCESFLAGIVRSRMALPVFQREHVDAGAIRVLRRAREITQERLASLLQVAFATVNRWEAGEHLPSHLRSIDEQLFAYFSRAPADDQPVSFVAPPIPRAGTLVRARERARRSFAHPQRSLDPTTHNKHI
jgi:transcriptional regulator with XRE-family HTH domain